ncbi:hypothetical protein ACWEIJ_25545 [Lentzea sp. NPDC004789]
MRSKGMLGAAVLAAVFTVAGVVTADASPANGELDALARVYAYQGDDYASTTGRWVEACDMERDGNGVYGEFWYGSSGHTYVWDGNGSAGGCGNQTLSSTVTRFRVCEDHGSCSAIIHTHF